MNRPEFFYVTYDNLKGSNEIDRFIPPIQGEIFSFYLFVYSEGSEVRGASRREFIISSRAKQAHVRGPHVDHGELYIRWWPPWRHTVV